MKYRIIISDTKVIRGKMLYRIQSLKDFGDVKKGDFGGYIDSYKTLSQTDNSWIGPDVCVYDSFISENSTIGGEVIVFNSKITNNSVIKSNSEIYDSTIFNTTINGKCKIDKSMLFSSTSEENITLENVVGFDKTFSDSLKCKKSRKQLT